jgi:hypothetical protein
VWAPQARSAMQPRVRRAAPESSEERRGGSRVVARRSRRTGRARLAALPACGVSSRAFTLLSCLRDRMSDNDEAEALPAPGAGSRRFAARNGGAVTSGLTSARRRAPPAVSLTLPEFRRAVIDQLARANDVKACFPGVQLRGRQATKRLVRSRRAARIARFLLTPPHAGCGQRQLQGRRA